ncbi:Transcriptional activator protein NhaR [Caulifigura coniformis]|uniref:Transcriptional activator protein NhaR n=1 Tax=Caulifigura coniformis TaxID=2527983 RepID=A0A517S8C5_9PLAN|nr:LysR family transcriptional regulator [Caulifigura coniformis]QDT52375.1 Transcriptional activator protein NhaR [Caulifigura coniformis]
MERLSSDDPYQLLRQINLNHLFYFWAVGQSGSITRAAARLGIAQPGVTNQIQSLERRLGARLIQRGSRGVTLTHAGHNVMRFAEEVVAICSDLARSLPLKVATEERPFVVGTVDSVPKVVVRSILKSVLSGDPPPQLICREWRIDRLLSELSLHRLDAVISDVPLPVPEGTPLETYAAGSSTIDIYAAPQLARQFSRGFPGCLHSAAMLLPYKGTSLRTSIDRWFALHRLEPRIAVETDDRALLHHFAESGLGLLPVATITAPDISRQFRLERIGSLRNVYEEYFVTTFHRPNEHSALDTLRQSLAAPTR